MTRTITIDPITRLEGHGKIEIFLDDDGAVEDCFFQIPELRGFERFVVGRPIEELPRIVTRICGVCPASHHMASAKAVDGCFGNEVAAAGPQAARHVLQRSLHPQPHRPLLRAGGARLRLRSRRRPGGAQHPGGGGQGGPGDRRQGHPGAGPGAGDPARPRRPDHPGIWCLPGGVSKGLKPEELEQIKPWVDELYDFAQFSLQLFRDVVLGNPAYVDLIVNGPYTLDVHNMGLVDENNAPNFYDGKVRVVDFEGHEIYKYEPRDYAEYVAEHVEPWTYLKFPYLKKRGWKGFVEGIDSSLYCATPLARLNVADRMATPKAQEAFEEMFTHPGRPSLQGAAGAALGPARGDGAERRDAPALLRRPGDHQRGRAASSRSSITGEGVGIVEAMRGTLTHHYTCDERGICTSANLIVGTTNNNAPIQMVTKKVAQALIKPGVEPDQGILNMVEMAFRAFDPCYSCATHSLGKMPLEAALYKNGELIKTIKRNC